MFKERVLIPLSLRRKVLKQSYSNHPWTNTIKAIARGCAYWHGMAIDIEGIVKGCLKFQLAAKGRPGENLIPWPGTRKPWSPVDVDFTDPINWATNSVMEDSHSNTQKITDLKIRIYLLRFDRFFIKPWHRKGRARITTGKRRPRDVILRKVCDH